MNCHGWDLNLELTLALMFHWPTETWCGRILALLDKILFISVFNTCYWMSHLAALMSELEEMVHAVLVVPGWLPRLWSKWRGKKYLRSYTHIAQRKTAYFLVLTNIFLCVYREERCSHLFCGNWYYAYIKKSKVELQR